MDRESTECDIPPEGWICTRGKGHDGPCAAIEREVDAIAAMLHGAWAAITEAQIRASYPELFQGSQAFYPSAFVKEQLVRCKTPFEHLPDDHKALARLHAAQIWARR